MASSSARKGHWPGARRRSHLVWIAAACSAFAALGGCTAVNENGTSPSGDALTPTSISETAPTAATADKAKQDAVASYHAMWQDFVSAGRTSDWQSSELGRHATGIALQKLSRGLYTDHQNGVVTRGEPALNPSVSSAEPKTKPTKIVITDCGDSTNFLKYDAKTGQLADDEPGGRRLINAIVELQTDGTWKVSDFGIHEVGSCG